MRECTIRTGAGAGSPGGSTSRTTMAVVARLLVNGGRVAARAMLVAVLAALTARRVIAGLAQPVAGRVAVAVLAALVAMWGGFAGLPPLKCGKIKDDICATSPVASIHWPVH